MPLSSNKIQLDLTQLTKGGKPSEIYSTGFEYSMVSPWGEACCHWVMCKDFLNDVVWGILGKNSVSIYGFRWNRTNFPRPDAHAVRLVVRNRRVTADKFHKQMESLAEFINQIEKEMGVSQTIIAPVANETKNPVYYIQSGIRWMRHPAMFSLYLLLLRTGCIHKLGSKWNTTISRFLKMSHKELTSEGMTANDQSYLKSSQHLVQPILLCGGQCFPPDQRLSWRAAGPNAVKNVGAIHSGSGIVALSRPRYGFPVRTSKRVEALGITIKKLDNGAVSITV